jgi:DNA polymerase III epsilon subunit-like protein
MTRTLIVDTETTGLDPSRHEIWELAVIDRESGTGYLWRLKPDLVKADPGALRVGRYYERTGDMCRTCRPGRVHDLTLDEGDDAAEWSGPEALAAHLAPLLDGATIIAANPAFDAGFLTAFLNHHGEAATWHYRLRDIGSMAWGWLQAHHLPHHLAVPDMSAGTDDLARELGVEPEKFERHSALGDCRMVAAMLDVIEGCAP